LLRRGKEVSQQGRRKHLRNKNYEAFSEESQRGEGFSNTIQYRMREYCPIPQLLDRKLSFIYGNGILRKEFEEDY
jgi:hypothetical protein